MNTPPESKSTKAQAGIASISAGTLVAGLAQMLRPENPWRTWLVLIAPTVSFVIHVAWLYVTATIANRIQERKFTALKNKIRDLLNGALANPQTSERHRALIRRKLETFEMMIIEREWRSMTSIQTVSMSDVREFESLLSQPETPEANKPPQKPPKAPVAS